MQIEAGDPRRLDLQSIIDESRATTGLSDFGEPDLLPGVQALLDALVREAELRPSGIEAQRANLVRVLCNRLRIENMLQRHPEILDEEIRGPIIITGLPRSGTTKMLRLMAADPGLQKLLLWKILNPAPLGPLVPGEPDPRIGIAEQLSATMREYFPDFYAGHPMNAHEPDEEEWLLDFVMRGYVNCHSARIPSFNDWMDTQDFSTWYVYLRKVLQLLQWQDGSSKKTWLLKAPSHMNRLNWLFETFPDATIVHCHRDPVTTITSISALTEACRRMYSDLDSAREGGRYMLEHWSAQLRGYMQLRPQFEQQHRFVDIAYSEITGDWRAAIKRIYAAAGVELSDEARAAMQAWEADNPQGKHGELRYTIEQYGLSRDEIRLACAPYLQRFENLI